MTRSLPAIVIRATWHPVSLRVDDNVALFAGRRIIVHPDNTCRDKRNEKAEVVRNPTKHLAQARERKRAALVKAQMDAGVPVELRVEAYCTRHVAQLPLVKCTKCEETDRKLVLKKRRIDEWDDWDTKYNGNLIHIERLPAGRDTIQADGAFEVKARIHCLFGFSGGDANHQEKDGDVAPHKNCSGVCLKIQLIECRDADGQPINRQHITDGTVPEEHVLAEGLSAYTEPIRVASRFPLLAQQEEEEEEEDQSGDEAGDAQAPAIVSLPDPTPRKRANDGPPVTAFPSPAKRTRREQPLTIEIAATALEALSQPDHRFVYEHVSEPFDRHYSSGVGDQSPRAPPIDQPSFDTTALLAAAPHHSFRPATTLHDFLIDACRFTPAQLFALATTFKRYYTTTRLSLVNEAAAWSEGALAAVPLDGPESVHRQSLLCLALLHSTGADDILSRSMIWARFEQELELQMAGDVASRGDDATRNMLIESATRAAMYTAATGQPSEAVRHITAAHALMAKMAGISPLDGPVHLILCTMNPTGTNLAQAPLLKCLNSTITFLRLATHMMPTLAGDPQMIGHLENELNALSRLKSCVALYQKDKAEPTVKLIGTAFNYVELRLRECSGQEQINAAHALAIQLARHQALPLDSFHAVFLATVSMINHLPTAYLGAESGLADLAATLVQRLMQMESHYWCRPLIDRLAHALLPGNQAARALAWPVQLI